MPQIDLSAWREHVNQGCTIGGKHVSVSESAFPSPCTSCICTNEGVSQLYLIIIKNVIKIFSLASMRIAEDHRLLTISSRMAKRNNLERWRVCSSMWLSSSKYKFSQSWFTATSNWSSTETSALTKSTTKLAHILLPRIPLPRPHTVYFWLMMMMMRNIRIIVNTKWP